mmetsp:Transcript_14031/g.36405  ORF Transcript_14031/g.36405 Transcript_14031/m.36405 type:complete len:227 (-) Transcript_14031:283-963(-)
MRGLRPRCARQHTSCCSTSLPSAGRLWWCAARKTSRTSSKRADRHRRRPLRCAHRSPPLPTPLHTTSPSCAPQVSRSASQSSLTASPQTATSGTPWPRSRGCLCGSSCGFARTTRASLTSGRPSTPTSSVTWMSSTIWRARHERCTSTRRGSATGYRYIGCVSGAYATRSSTSSMSARCPQQRRVRWRCSCSAVASCRTPSSSSSHSWRQWQHAKLRQVAPCHSTQ